LALAGTARYAQDALALESSTGVPMEYLMGMIDVFNIAVLFTVLEHICLLHISIALGLEDLHDAVNLIIDLHNIIRATQVDNATADIKER
jgi:hypothetical protein